MIAAPAVCTLFQRTVPPRFIVFSYHSRWGAGFIIFAALRRMLNAEAQQSNLAHRIPPKHNCLKKEKTCVILFAMGAMCLLNRREYAYFCR